MVPVSLEHWGMVLTYLLSNCKPGMYRAWLSQTTPVTIDDMTIARPGDPVLVACPSQQSAEWLSQNFTALVEHAIQDCTGARYPVRFVVRDPASDEFLESLPADLRPPSDIVTPSSPHMVGTNGNGGANGSSNGTNGNGNGYGPWMHSGLPPQTAPTTGRTASQPTQAQAQASGSGLDHLVPADDGADFDYQADRTPPRPMGTATAQAPARAMSPPMQQAQQMPPMPQAQMPMPQAPPMPQGQMPMPQGQVPMPHTQMPMPQGPATAGDGIPQALPQPRLYTDTHSLPVNPLNTFETYIVGPSNRLPHAAALTVADHPGVAYNPLFLHGSVGLGKTHLLQAIHLRIQQRNPGARLLYISCETFVSQFIKALESRELDRFQRQFRELDCLIIDDIHFLGNKGGTQEEFFHTFNALYNAQKQIVISSDRPPTEIPQLQERLVSRFKCGLQGKIEPPVFETRVAIFRQKAQRLGLDLQDEILHFLAEHFRSNVREMEGAIKRLAAEMEHNGNPVTVEQVPTYLRDLLDERQSVMKPQVTVDDIVTVVTDYYQIKLADLKSKNRQKHVVLPRQVSMFLAKKHTDRTLEEIGNYFGGRDHSTVIHSIEKIRKMHDDDREFRQLVMHLERKIVTT